MKKSIKILIVFIAALALLFGGMVIGTRGKRAEAMYGGAVLVLAEKVDGDGR